MTDSALPCGLPAFDQPGFLDWYLYGAGLSKVPPQFHLWAGIGALAAAVGDRVWFEKFTDEKLYPNLYVMLIGPSGTGKNQAWRRAQRRMEMLPSDEQLAVRLYRGKITAEAILSRLGNKKHGSRIWLVTPELAMQVGNGPKAESFITHMTELFDGDTVFQDDTRTSGQHHITNPVINWGSGTTNEWLLRAVGKQDILGGFFARICAIPGERTPERYAKVIYPHDHREVDAWCSAYLTYLTHVTGRFTWDDAADELHTWWYENRAEPDNPLLWNYYEHGDNMVYKLGMLMALSDQHKLVGEYVHMQAGIALYEWVYGQLGGVLEFAYRTPEVEKLEMVRELIASAPFMDHSRLLRAVTTRGMMRDDLERMVKTLLDRGDITQSNIAGKRSFRWIGETR